MSVVHLNDHCRDHRDSFGRRCGVETLSPTLRHKLHVHIAEVDLAAELLGIAVELLYRMAGVSLRDTVRAADLETALWVLETVQLSHRPGRAHLHRAPREVLNTDVGVEDPPLARHSDATDGDLLSLLGSGEDTLLLWGEGRMHTLIDLDPAEFSDCWVHPCSAEPLRLHGCVAEEYARLQELRQPHPEQEGVLHPCSGLTLLSHQFMPLEESAEARGPLKGREHRETANLSSRRGQRHPMQGRAVHALEAAATSAVDNADCLHCH
mmetsp:Transcript_26834/g.78123  ORF Transcript_26834/g.78123 Transcript_26834/m.78123 type:complete len:266 (-) Transcript_26834:456-1253(-)